MPSDEEMSLDPLKFIRRCVQERKIYWTYHVNIRLRERFISRRVILDSIDKYEIIEKYLEDKYLPSYLIYSVYKGVVFHVLFAIDVEGNNVRIITAYRPNLHDWKEDFKTRRRS